MTRNQLPEGVGKKIVEALKRQAEADITPTDENNLISNTLPLTEIENVSEITNNTINEETSVYNDNFIVEEDTPVMPVSSFGQVEDQIISEEPVIQHHKFKEDYKVQEQPRLVQPQSVEFQDQAIIKEISVPRPSSMQANTVNYQEQPVNVNKIQENAPRVSTSQTKIPANVAVLKNLIATLPAGVSKQTGAQIIRQTLEAMGLPMNSVLKEAQDVQEELNSTTKECILKIQEYKTNIIRLEQTVQDNQNNITQLNDLVSLFLLTGKDN